MKVKAFSMWVKAQHVGPWAAALLASVAWTCSGCSSARSGTGCVEGLRSSCTCESGGLGIHTCQSDSTFNACDCTMGPHAGSAAVTGGNSGSNAGSAGRAGVSAGGRSGGSGGSAGRSGAGGQAGTGIVGVAAYGACHATTDCRANATCLRASTSTNAPGYCSPNCTGGGLQQCFRIAVGEVRASCSNGSCVLGSCDQLACPPGMSCVIVMNPMGSGPSMTSSCVYPNQ